MNLLRKMSSGLRSSKKGLSASGEQSIMVEAAPSVDQRVEPAADRVQEMKGAFEDAATAPVQQQSEEKVEQENGGGGGREEEEAEEEDERASHGSGDSFNSALERMAASSDASNDTAPSPRAPSPVGSPPGPAVSGIPPASAVDKVEKSEGVMQSDQTSAKFEDYNDAHSLEPSTVVSLEPLEGPQSPRPNAKLPAKQESGGEALEGSEQEKATAKGVQRNGGVGADDVMAKTGEGEEDVDQPQVTHKEAIGSLDSGEAHNDSNVFRDSNGGIEEHGESVSALDVGDQKPIAQQAGVESSPPVKRQDSSEEADGTQTKPVAKLSDDGIPSLVDDTGVQSASSGAPQVGSKELPGDMSLRIPGQDSEAVGQSSDKSAGEKAVEGKDATKITSEEDAFLRNLGDAEEGDKEDAGTEENDDAFLAELVRAAESVDSDDGGAAAPSLGSAGPSLPTRPTRTVRSSLPSLDPASRAAQQPRSTGSAPMQSSSASEESSEPADGHQETREKLQSIRVQFLRLALRLGQSVHNVVVAQVLYRLGLAEQLRGGRSSSRSTAFSFDRASRIAEEQERAGPEELDFSCTIMILGKTGVGKSATINSIFDEEKTGTNAFGPATNKVQTITGLVHGIKVRVIDTPGLLPSIADQRHNEKTLNSVKGFIKKHSPDIVLYFDRLDMQSRDYGDLPLLRTITDTFGASVWFNAIVVLTHASSAPPDGPNGLPLSYETFVAQRSHVVQQTIRQAAGDMRLMNPVSLVENHRACRVNRAGDRVLPNGHVWKPQLLLLCFASKILAEANSLLKLQDSTPGKPFGQRSRVPPLPFLLSSLLQSRTPLKLPDEQVGDEDESDDSDEEDEDSDDEEDYDQLPPFRRLAKEEVAELDDINRGQYYEELAERERLFQKKQWREELKRRREMKKRMAEAPANQPQFGDDGIEDEARAAAVPVPMPDMVLPPSFDSDNPAHRYRYLETANQWLVRPVLETHGWDHDNGYDGMSVEKIFVAGNRIPTSVSGQITKDKKESNLNMECAASLKHGEGKVTLAGLDLQTVGKDLAYTLRSETRFSNFKGNKTTGGLALTLLGDTVSAGMKIEDRLIAGKRVKLVVNGGAITGGGDVAYGGSLEATLRDKDFPLSRTLSTLGLSIMDWHGDMAVGGNLQSQFILGKTMMVGRANLNNRGAGQISIRASSSEQLQMTLIGIIPLVRAIANRLFGQSQQ